MGAGWRDEAQCSMEILGAWGIKILDPPINSMMAYIIIVRKVINIVANRCHFLGLRCTQFLTTLPRTCWLDLMTLLLRELSGTG